MTVNGLDTHVTSAIIPTFMICASICPKPACRRSPTGFIRDQDPGRTHDRSDDIAHPQRELLHAPAHAGTDNRLVQLHLGLGQRSFGAGLLGWEKRRNPRLYGLSCSRGGSDPTQAAFDKKLKLLDFALRDDTRIAFLQLLLGLQFVHGLLVRALGLLDLAFSLQEIGPRHHQVRLDLRNLAPRGLDSRLLLRAVQSENRRSFGDLDR